VARSGGNTFVIIEKPPSSALQKHSARLPISRGNRFFILRASLTDCLEYFILSALQRAVQPSSENVPLGGGRVVRPLEGPFTRRRSCSLTIDGLGRRDGRGGSLRPGVCVEEGRFARLSGPKGRRNVAWGACSGAWRGAGYGFVPARGGRC